MIFWYLCLIMFTGNFIFNLISLHIFLHFSSRCVLACVCVHGYCLEFLTIRKHVPDACCLATASAIVSLAPDDGLALSCTHTQVELSSVRFSLYGQYKGRDRRGSNTSSARGTPNNSSASGAAGGGVSATSSSSGVPQRQGPRKSLSLDARPYYPSPDGNNDHMAPNVQQLADSLFPKVHAIRPVSF